MNRKEWKLLHCTKDILFWYNKTRSILELYEHNTHKHQLVIHHLRDTEEQRKYNDEHYELWGHNLDGTFEYGKYVIFISKSEHAAIHGKGDNNPFYGKRHSDETKKTIKQKTDAYWSLEDSHIRHSEILKQHYKNNPVSDETKHKLSESLKGRTLSEEDIQHIKYGRAHSTKVAEHNKDMQVCKEHYSLIKEYKFISWNNFQKLFKKDYYLLKAIVLTLCKTVFAM